MTDYRVEVKVKNNNILKRMEQSGYSSVGEFCRLNDRMKWASAIGDLVNMKRSPLTSKGTFLPIVDKICNILDCSPEDLFSEVQLTTALESNKRTIEVNEAEMQFMLENREEVLLMEDKTHKDRLPVKIDEALATLTPREAKIISMRFGLGEYPHAHQHKEVAQHFEVTTTRIAQIESKALRKLRHPSRAKVLREYIM